MEVTIDTAILQFSPSGNTALVTAQLIDSLSRIPDSRVQLVSITGDPEFFSAKNLTGYLESKVGKHDLLLIGSPVYAHHLQYHMKDILAALPEPDGKKWGRLALPYVTYGGISSGIALEEAYAILKKTGRTVAGGMKIASSHRMTRAFLDTDSNEGKPGEELLPVAPQFEALARDIASGKECGDIGMNLRYQPRIKKLLINMIFDEKKWHRERYPKIHIDKSKCSSCGKCASICPVLRLAANMEGPVSENERNECIHCLNCVSGCPQKAITLVGDLEKGKAFMNMMIRKNGNRENPQSALYS